MNNGWKTKSLGEISQINSGGTPLKSKSEFWDGGRIPWYTSGELNDVYTKEPKDYITQAGLEGSNAKLFPKGSLLIGMYDTAALKTSILDRDASFNQAVAGILPNEEANFRYLLYAIWHVRPEVLKLRRGVRQKNLSLAKIKAISVPYPTPREQERIVEVLETTFSITDHAARAAEKNLVNAREMVDSYLNQLFAEQDRYGWEAKPLESVCDFSSGGTPSKKNPKFWGGDIPWVSGRDMKSTRISDTSLHITQQAVDESSSARIAPANDLLILVRGMGLAHGAQIAELMGPCAFNQDIRAIHPAKGISSRYLLFALRTRINLSEHVMSNAAHGTLKIDMDSLRQIPVPIPTLQTQQEVVRAIDDLCAARKQLENVYSRKQACLEELQRSVLQRAFTGQLTAEAVEQELANA